MLIVAARKDPQSWGLASSLHPPVDACGGAGEECASWDARPQLWRVPNEPQPAPGHFRWLRNNSFRSVQECQCTGGWSIASRATASVEEGYIHFLPKRSATCLIVILRKRKRYLRRPEPSRCALGWPASMACGGVWQVCAPGISSTRRLKNAYVVLNLGNAVCYAPRQRWGGRTFRGEVQVIGYADH